ncbi:MAG: hypothetical protein LQ351_004487 [Letrouitia transgressa]|nr:MAG: hypothetical protein LQ351_004487 [Letrouitia transgressa]
MKDPNLSSFMAITAYAPIALFTESLRVQRAMVASILSPHSIAPAVTGCVKDLHRLWGLDDVQLFGNFKDERAACVASVKHGNSFPLQNQTVLQLAGVVRGDIDTARMIIPYEPSIGKGLRTWRETFVSLCFMLPRQAGSERYGLWWLQGVCWVVTIIEFVGPMVMAAYMAIWNDVAGVILMVCFSLSVLILAVLRSLTRPIIANQSEISKFRSDVAKGTSTLDVHVITDHWNDKHLNIVCGYTSHLHALTNIPMTISRPTLLLWASRGLAVVLVSQAASLASLIGDKKNAWLSLSWLGVYILMMIPPRIVCAYYSQASHEHHTAVLIKVPPIRFSCRRAALVFISRLPTSRQAYVEPWAWTDVFIPDNERRRRWQAHIDSLDLITFESDPAVDGRVPSEELDAEYRRSKDLLKEASAVYHHPQVLQPLLWYRKSVGLQNI